MTRLVGMVLLCVARDQSSTVTSEFKPAPVNSTESSPVVPDPSPGRDTGRLRGPDAHATGLQEQPLPTHGLCYLSAVFDGDRAVDTVYRDVAADVSLNTCPPPSRIAIVGLLGSANQIPEPSTGLVAGLGMLMLWTGLGRGQKLPS